MFYSLLYVSDCVNHLLGQLLILHAFIWTSSPVQLAPPLYGPSHFRCLSWLPPPHDTLQFVHADHDFHTPSTDIEIDQMALNHTDLKYIYTHLFTECNAQGC